MTCSDGEGDGVQRKNQVTKSIDSSQRGGIGTKGPDSAGEGERERAAPARRPSVNKYSSYSLRHAFEADNQI